MHSGASSGKMVWMVGTSVRTSPQLASTVTGSGMRWTAYLSQGSGSLRIFTRALYTPRCRLAYGLGENEREAAPRPLRTVGVAGTCGRVAQVAVIDIELSLNSCFSGWCCLAAKLGARGRCQCSVGVPPLTPQHFLNFLPLPQGQGSFLPTLGSDLTTGIIGVFIPEGCVASYCLQ